MLALRLQTTRHRFLEALWRWMACWTGIRPRSAELEFCGQDEVQRMAQDLGLSSPELRSLARRGPDERNLLQRRMAALRLDHGELARRDPALVRDLQRVCASFSSPGRCARDLKRQPNKPDWQEYCPNAPTLGALSKPDA